MALAMIAPPLTCGCTSCRSRLEREFYAIVKRSYSYAEFLALREHANNANMMEDDNDGN